MCIAFPFFVVLGTTATTDTLCSYDCLVAVAAAAIAAVVVIIIIRSRLKSIHTFMYTQWQLRLVLSIQKSTHAFIVAYKMRKKTTTTAAAGTATK